MMFEFVHPLPRKYWVAVSGGVDSMSILHFLDKPSRRDALLGVVHLNHNTGKFADSAEELVTQHCVDNKIILLKFRLNGKSPKGRSKEDWWREKRYKFFNGLPGDDAVILGHNMNDCLEEYIMCTMVRGYAGTIPYQRGRCIRPFRLWKRNSIENYANTHNLKYLNDPSNFDTKFTRSKIRHNILPKIINLNPGVFNIVKKLIVSERKI